MSRQSICFPRWGTQDVTTGGDEGFEQELLRWYSRDEAVALEGLVNLKAHLRTLPTEAFLTAAVEGISHIMGSDMAFIIKRILVDDQSSAIEMPPLGEPGSCLMAAALHYCTNSGEKHTVKENTFHAYACPCAYMRHDKIFVIPENIDSFITNNPNQVPIPVDAYMAVPLFAEGKCVAHFGVMWSKETSPNQRLSWAFVEMLLHALEDMIGQRLLEGSNFTKPVQYTPPVAVTPPPDQQSRVVPHHAISLAQSLRPYAGSLSHELRTPMQGVVGMLDVMYATVQDAVESAGDAHLKKVFQNLIESIEVVQDSSRRAVVAADNVVHAYDMNMSVPESAHAMDDGQGDGGDDDNSCSDCNLNGGVSPRTRSHDFQYRDRQPDIVVAGHDLPLARSASKRRRRGSDALEHGLRSKAPKVDIAFDPRSIIVRQRQDIENGSGELDQMDESDDRHTHTISRQHDGHVQSPEARPIPGVTHGHHHVHRSADIKAVLRTVINEGLKTGGRPDYVSPTPIDQGEIIEVRTRGSDTTSRQMIIKWEVDDDLPRTLNYDEKDFSKLLSCVFLNAVKFSDRVDARVDVQARRSAGGKHAMITVDDNGPGMPAEFLPKLFQPFSQKDRSITRQSDGLGLGLMVAKGIARKLGGDLICLKSEVQPPNNGCKFEIKLPLASGEPTSMPTSPLSSPMYARRPHSTAMTSHQMSLDTDQIVPPQSGTTKPSHVATWSDGQLGLKRSLSAINDLANASKARTSFKSRSSTDFQLDRALSKKYPLTFLVAEDNKINRKLLVSMLSKFGYTDIIEAHDGVEAVRQMTLQAANQAKIDVVLMDLWMPLMDGYEATEKILQLNWNGVHALPTILAVTADVTDDALNRAAQVGMKGFMTKPYKLQDLQRLITEYCVQRLALPIEAATLQPTALVI